MNGRQSPHVMKPIGMKYGMVDGDDRNGRDQGGEDQCPSGDKGQGGGVCGRRRSGCGRCRWPLLPLLPLFSHQSSVEFFLDRPP